jgi:hypothetical protein
MVNSRLPHAQISQNVFRSSEDRIEFLRTITNISAHARSSSFYTEHQETKTRTHLRLMEMLNMPPHPRLRQSPPSKDHHGITSDLPRRDRTLHLQKADLPGEVFRSLVVGHVAHLVGDGFEPCLEGFDFGYHVRQSVQEGGRGGLSDMSLLIVSTGFAYGVLVGRRTCYG